MVSVALSLEQAPFTSEIVGSILATNSGEKSLSTLSKVVAFSGYSGFLPQGESTGWVVINIISIIIVVKMSRLSIR